MRSLKSRNAVSVPVPQLTVSCSPSRTRMVSSPSSPRTVSPAVSFGPWTSRRASANSVSLPGAAARGVLTPRLAKIAVVARTAVLLVGAGAAGHQVVAAVAVGGVGARRRRGGGRSRRRRAACRCRGRRTGGRGLTGSPTSGTSPTSVSSPRLPCRRSGPAWPSSRSLPRLPNRRSRRRRRRAAVADDGRCRRPAVLRDPHTRSSPPCVDGVVPAAAEHAVVARAGVDPVAPSSTLGCGRSRRAHDVSANAVALKIARPSSALARTAASDLAEWGIAPPPD